MNGCHRDFIKEKYAEGLKDVEIAKQVPYSLAVVRSVLGTPHLMSKLLTGQL